MRAGDVHEVSMCRSVKKSVLAGGQKKSMSANYIHVRRCLPNRHHIVSIYLPFSRTQPPFLGLKELPTALHHEDLTRYFLSLPVSHLDQRNVELFELFANPCNWQAVANGVTWGWSVGSIWQPFIAEGLSIRKDASKVLFRSPSGNFWILQLHNCRTSALESTSFRGSQASNQTPRQTPERNDAQGV